MNFELLLTNISYITSGLITASLGIFVFIKGENKHVTGPFLAMALLLLLFSFSHILGSNVRDPRLSQMIFVLNGFNMFIVATNAHWIFGILGKVRQQKWPLIIMYTVGTILLLIFLAFPSTFMLPSKPVLYFPNYYVQGPLYPLSDIYFFTVLIYFSYHLVRAYRKADFIMRNRLKFVILGLFLAYLTGLIPLFPLYGIDIDPVISIFSGFIYSSILAYSILKYDLIDMNVVGKRAILYAASVGFVGVCIVLINSLDKYVHQFYPGFPALIVPLVSSAVVVAVAFFVGKKIKEVDALKYEFVKVVTHKFRTPLTYIKWSTDELKSAKSEEAFKKAVGQIETAGDKLVELTNVLMGAAAMEENQSVYRFQKIHLAEIFKKVLDSRQERIREKNLSVSVADEENNSLVSLDMARIEFVLQILLDNAINYTTLNGSIAATIYRKNAYTQFVIKDSGIGIAPEDISHIFQEFYRTSAAAKTDTEGMGVGLYIAKQIVERLGGRIWVESEGLDKGTSFFIRFRTVSA